VLRDDEGKEESGTSEGLVLVGFFTPTAFYSSHPGSLLMKLGDLNYAMRNAGGPVL
jgi:hypothetical protein